MLIGLIENIWSKSVITDLHEETIVLGDGDLRHTTKVTELHVLQLVHVGFVFKYLNTSYYRCIVIIIIIISSSNSCILKAWFWLVKHFCGCQTVRFWLTCLHWNANAFYVSVWRTSQPALRAVCITVWVLAKKFVRKIWPRPSQTLHNWVHYYI